MGGKRGFSEVTSPMYDRHTADILQPLRIKIFVLLTKHPPLFEIWYEIDLDLSCVFLFGLKD